VLVAGGEDKDFNFLPNAEIFDPATGQWTPTGSLGTALQESTLTLLPNGKVLAEAGFITRTAQLYDVGLGFPNSSQPQIATVTGLNLGDSLSLTGSGFRGLSESSGGNGSQSSASDCPVVQLRNIESGHVLVLSSADWQTNRSVSLPVFSFPPGPALVTVFVNGVPSASRILLVSPGSSIVLHPMRLPNGSFQFEFADTSGGSYTAVATTNISLAQSNWTTLGPISEVSPGQFRFIDPQAANNPRRLYRVRSP